MEIQVHESRLKNGHLGHLGHLLHRYYPIFFTLKIARQIPRERLKKMPMMAMMAKDGGRLKPAQHAYFKLPLSRMEAAGRVSGRPARGSKWGIRAGLS